MPFVTKTLSVRIRDKHAKVLSRMAFDVNQVWNAANELTAEFGSLRIPDVGWVNGQVSEFDLNKELKGLRDERSMTIGAATVQSVIAQHARSRKQFKKKKLSWRCSGGAKKSLGWVPFKTAGVKIVAGQVRFCGHHFKVWDSYGLSGHDLKTGSFAEDSRGRWYFNATVEVETVPSLATTAVGVDLGLKAVATCSDGFKLDRTRHTDAWAAKLAIAQRAHKKQRVRAIHAKIKAQRKDALHKFTTAMVTKYGAIFVGDVSSQKLAKTRMAKSIHDAGWHMLKTQLESKAIARSVVFEEVDEKYTTVTCSNCQGISDSGPKGRAGLRMREWTCALCGTTHDRDVNAARNILARGHARLEGGITAL